MRKIQKALLCLLATVFLLAKGTFAQGIDNEIVQADQEQSVEATMSEVLANESTEDPLYGQYHQNISLMSGGSKLTIATAKTKILHQSKFGDKYQKSYGIDISKWQGNIDWKKVKADGVEFAIIRLGYRGMANGALALDSCFVQNIKGAHEAGISVGIYFFTQAITTEEAKEEAEYCIKQLAPYKSYVTYPVMIDIEPSGGRLDKANLSKSQKTAICDKFCSTIENAGYRGGIYCSKSYYSSWLNANQLENKYYIWLAHYTDNTDYTGRYDMWQFSSSCSVNGISGYVDMDVAYRPVTPDTPWGLNQKSGTSTSVTLSWTGINGVAGYKIYRYDSKSKLQESYYSNTPDITIDNLQAGMTCYFKVRAYNDFDGTIAFSKYSDEIVAYTAPTAVSDLKTMERRKDSVVLSWTKSDSVYGYRIRMYDAATDTYTTLKNTTEGTYTVTGLKAAKAYLIQVQPYCKMNDSTKLYSEESLNSNIYTLPGDIKGVKCKKSASKSVRLTWNVSARATGYRVYIYNAKKKQIAKYDTDTNEILVKGLTVSTDYTVRVRSFYGTVSGKMIYGDLTKHIAFSTCPGVISSIKQKNVSTGMITVSWGKKAGADGYKVYIYDTSVNAYKKLVTTKKTSYTLTKLKSGAKLKSGTAYKIKVVAYKQSGDKQYASDNVKEFHVTTLPANVQSLRLEAKTKSSVTLSWKKSAGAESYQIKVYKGKKLVEKYTTDELTYKVKGLSAKTGYQFKVRAITESEYTKAYSGTSAVITATTK